MHPRSDSLTSRIPRRARRTRLHATVLACGVVAALCSSLVVSGSARAATTSLRPAAKHPAAPRYPIGIYDVREPSHYRPPAVNALAGYQRTYVDDFTGALSPRRWFLFNGVPSGDPSGRFSPSHVSVRGGMLRIGTWRDSNYGNAWVSGGAGLSGEPFQYGAMFVRSRETAPGPDTVELLWPANNQWPPEIDFDEAGNAVDAQWWFVHYDNPQDRVYGHAAINIEQWHTYGVIWTPSYLKFTVDGKLWGETTARYAIPDLAMALDLQAQSWCGIQGEPCPTQNSTLLIDWVELYTPK